MTTMANLILRADASQIDRARGSVDALAQSGSKLAGILGVAFGVKEVIEASQEYTRLTNRLSLVTTSSEQLAAAQQQLFDIAQRTRAPLAATAELYQRIATNAGALGLTLNEVGQTTETINKLMAISGTSGESAAAALTQLGQAFASGTLRGEELNSVMEQAPALAKAIADGMGVTTGQLRAMGQEGLITSTAVIDALNKQGAAVDEQFKKMTPTIDQAMTQAGNSFVNLVGKLDSATGASKGLATAISEISKSMDGSGLEYLSRVFGTWGASFADASKNADHLKGSFDGLTEGAKAITWFIGQAFVEMPANVKAMIGITTVHIAAFIDDVSSRFERAKDKFRAIWTDETIADAYANHAIRQKAIADNAEAAIAAILKQRDAEIELGQARANQIIAPIAMDTLDEGGGDPAKIIDQKKIEQLKKEKERQEKWLAEKRIYWQNEITDYMDMLEKEGIAEQDAWNNKLKTLTEMFATQTELEQQQYAQRLTDYATYAEMARVSEEEQRAMREKLEAEHGSRLAAIKIEQDDKAGKSEKSKLSATASVLNSLYTITGSHNARMLRAAQVAGAAVATINAYQAASETLKDPLLPWWMRVSVALGVLSAGMGFAGAIKGGGGGGGSVGSSSAPDTSGIAQQQAQQVQAQTVDFRVQRQGRTGWTDDDVADLMESIGSRLADGAKFGKVEFMTA
jgi:tape measure domain-containing protein